MRWFACSEQTIPPGVAWLTTHERARLARLRFTKRRTEYLLRRWVGKQAAAAAIGLPSLLEDPEAPRSGRSMGSDLARASDPTWASRIAVLNHPSGAPYVEVDGRAVDLDISLTDRAGHAVALVGPAGSMGWGTLGVDLEIVEPRSAGFVTDFCTAAEATWVRGERAAYGPGGWDAGANLLWSAKEAALKVLGVGLRADTRTVDVVIHGSPSTVESRDLLPLVPDHSGWPVAQAGWAPLRVHHDGGGVLPGWWRREGHFLLTLASREETSPPIVIPGSLDLAKAIPVHSWVANPLADPEGRSGP